MAHMNGSKGGPWGVIALAVVLGLGLTGHQSLKLAREIDKSRTVDVSTLSPQERQAAEARRKKDAEEAIAALAAIKSYDAARWHPIHFKPAIDQATDAQCLACHKEILSTKMRATAPAGVTAAQAIAWYQTLDTYEGEQQSFHARHLNSSFSSQVMQLSCNFCHQGHDLREEAPGSSATTADVGNMKLRKQINPESSCLMCHGRFPKEFMEGVDQPWHVFRENVESADQPNGCLTCHEQLFRTVRHKVSYLKADAIEQLAKTSSDVCFGCHGGRAWFRTTYPYPRTPWPDMPKEVPEWAKSRPTASDPRYALGAAR